MCSLVSTTTNRAAWHDACPTYCPVLLFYPRQLDAAAMGPRPYFRTAAPAPFQHPFARAEHPDYFALWLASGALLKKSPSLGEHDLRRLPELDPTPALRDTVLPDGVSGRLMQIAFVPQRDEDEDNSEVGVNTGEAKKDAAAEQHKDEAEEADDTAESLVQQLNAMLRRQKRKALG